MRRFGLKLDGPIGLEVNRVDQDERGVWRNASRIEDVLDLSLRFVFNPVIHFLHSLRGIAGKVRGADFGFVILLDDVDE